MKPPPDVLMPIPAAPVTPSNHGVTTITAVPNGHAGDYNPPGVRVGGDTGAAFFDEDDTVVTLDNSKTVNQHGTAPSTPTEPPKPRHPKWLLDQVDELQLPPTLLDVMDTNELAQTVTQFLRRQSKDRDITSQNLKNAQPAPTPVATVATPEPTPQDQIDWGVHDDTDQFGVPTKRKYEDADVSPAVVKVVRDLRAEVKSLKNDLAEIKRASAEFTKAQAANRTRAELDAVFDRMPDTFGRGDARTLDKDQYMRRAAVANAVKTMMENVPPEAKLTITQATLAMAKSLFRAEPEGDEPVATVATPQPAPAKNGKARTPPTPADFQNGQVARPTNRNGSSVPAGRQKAIDGITDWFERHKEDVGDSADDQVSLDEFLK